MHYECGTEDKFNITDRTLQPMNTINELHIEREVALLKLHVVYFGNLAHENMRQRAL